MEFKFTVYDLQFKYKNSVTDNVRIFKDDTIEVYTEILPSNISLDASAYIEDTTIASINNNIITGINEGDTYLVAKINNETFKLPIFILREPNIIYENFKVTSNVKGNQELDNFFGGKIEATAEFININDTMTIEKNIIDKNNNVTGCFDATFVNSLEKNKININVQTKQNCIESGLLESGTYKIRIKVIPYDTKNSEIIFYQDININNYKELTTITSNIEKINLKIGDTYQINDEDLTFGPNDATNKNVKYIDYDTEIININDEGTITALKSGVTTIKVQSVYNEEIYDTIKVMVNPIINDIKTEDIIISNLYNNDNQLYFGYAGKVTAKISTENIIDNERFTIKYYKDDIEQNDMSNIFDTTNRPISNNATSIDLYVGPNQEPGTYKIELCYENAECKSFEFVINQPLKVTSIEAGNIIIPNDGSLSNINYKIIPDDAFNQDVEFEIADNTIATIEDGKIKGLKVGNTTLTIKSTDGSNIEKTVNVSVVDRSIVINNIKLENDVIYETFGGKLSFRITLINIDSKKVKLNILNETDESVYNEEVSINDKGYADVELEISKELAAGTYTIKVTDGNIEKNATFEITNYKEVENLIFMYNQKELSKLVLLNEDEINITSVITNENSTFKDITYSIKDTSIATVTENGLITGIKAGKTELIATIGFQTFTLPIEIINNPVVEYGVLNTYSNVEGNNTIDNHYGGKYTIEANFSEMFKDLDFVRKDKGIIYNYVINKNVTPEHFTYGDFNLYVSKCENNSASFELTFSKHNLELNGGVNAIGGTYVVYYYYYINDTKETRIKDSFEIELKEYIELTAINLSETNLTLDINESKDIKSLITLEPNTATNKNVKYETNDSNILKIEGSTITGINEGIAKITVISLDNENIKNTINVKVERSKYLEFGNNINIYNNGSKYLKFSNENNTYKELKRSINTNLFITLKDTNGVDILDTSSILKTGMKLNIGENNYNIVIKGDINGDGKVSITDLSQMRYHLAKVTGKEKTGAYELAADMNNSNTVSITDLSQMRKKLAGGN